MLAGSACVETTLVATPADTQSVGGEDEFDVQSCAAGNLVEAYDWRVEWEWEAAGKRILTIPLVANLTDDNDDGVINVDDFPDVVIAAGEFDTGPIHILDGATGALHTTSSEPVAIYVTPAIGDIDADGLPEIVAHGAAFEHDCLR